MYLFVNTNNETDVTGHGNHDIINNNILLKRSIGSRGENVYVVTSGHEILDIDNLPIPEVILYHDLNKENSLKDVLDLRPLVRQVHDDLSLEPISKFIEDRNDLLIKLYISATALNQDIVTVRLKDALVNNWYKELQVILNNAPMKISSVLQFKPVPLVFDKDKEVIVVTPQDVEENRELIISKEVGEYTFLHSGYDVIITNALNDDMETNKFCTIYLKDFFKDSKMETLSIRFNDTEILLSDEKDKIYNSDNINDYIRTNVVISKLQESFTPSETASSHHPIRYRRHKDHSRREDGMHLIRQRNYRVQKRNINYKEGRNYNIDQQEIATGSGIKPSSWINNCISWVKNLAVSTFSIIPVLPAQYNIADKNNVLSDNKNTPQSTTSVGWNKFLNNENIVLASCVADALDNTPSKRYQYLISKGVEVLPNSKIAVEFALRKFDSFVEGKIRNLGSNEQARVRVELKDAYPEIRASLERGVEFSGNIGLDNVLEKCENCFRTNFLPKNKVPTFFLMNE